MNENSRKLVEALRSGEYQQTKYRLRDENGFCCLGVACDVYAKETGKGKWHTGSSDYYFKIDEDEYEEDGSRLPYSVQIWLGFSSVRGGRSLKNKSLGNFVMPYGGYSSSLTRLNDSGSTFSEIADIIEFEPEGLF